ncbi:MAG: UDP-glucose 4-epimerase GalE [Crocinitomicaceae bacterium]|nr:UDP-glucose 4-epimerase GalE [Flavobacteriales bacterium]NQZ35715.1 UDP-glucose 4-epimerase GalE [Crocinitomicaceae bacterium]
MKQNEYILVTGGAGYIGSHTVVELIEDGKTPVIVDDFRNADLKVLSGIEKIVGQSVICHQIDVCDFQAMHAVFEQYSFTGIIHFAAYKAVGESVEEPLKYFDNNLNSLLVCLSLAEEFNVNNFLFSSSCTVYGEPVNSPVVTEESPVLEANSPYGATKQMCERILSDLTKSGSDIRVLNLRYFNPIGAHSSSLIGELPSGEPSNLLPYVTQTAFGILDQLTVYGNNYNTIDGTCVRDYIHVSDLANAHVKGLDWLTQQTGTLNEVINVGTGQGSSVLEIIHTFENVSNIQLNWKFGERRLGDVEQIYADVTKAKKMLNWSAQRTMEDAVRDAWNWEQKRRNETTDNS